MAKSNKVGVYNPQQAAEFLGVSENQMKKLLEKNLITPRSHNRETYYLGGELDVTKSILKDSLVLRKELGQVSVLDPL